MKQGSKTFPRQSKLSLASQSSNNQNGNKNYDQDRIYFHIKVVAIILSFLLLAQISIYFMVQKISKIQTQQSQFIINQLRKETQKHHLQISFYNFTDLNKLQIQLADINQKIKQFQISAQFHDKNDQILHQLTQRSQLLESLIRELSSIEQVRKTKEETTIQYIDKHSQQYRFIFPKKIWLYDQLKEGYYQKMNELYQMNVQRVGKTNSFQVQLINKYNFFNFINPIRYIRMLKTLQNIKKFISKNEYFSQNTYDQIKRSIMMLLVLQANGGIMVSKYLAFVENFNWLEQITKNIFINTAASGIPPKVFGFYNMSRSSNRVQLTNRTLQNRFKFLVKYPGIIPYFLVAVKGSDFVHDLTNQVFQMLQNPSKYISDTENLRKGSKVQSIQFISQRRIFEQFFQLGTIMTLLRKEKRLGIKDVEDNMIGIDYYGLVTMNANYGPQKITFFFQNNQGKKILQHLSKFDINEFQLQIGKIRYISKLPSYYELNDYVNNVTIYKEFMIKNSYFHLHFYPNSTQKFVEDPVQKPQVYHLAKSWSDLPKIIWIYWHSSLERSNIIYQLCADNIQRFGEQSGFSVRFVSDSNLQDYLDADIIDRIEYAVNHQAGITKSKYITYDLIRLALVARHGGVYMDLSYIMLQNLDWLVNIPKYPSNLIFNRYGQKPQNFMFFHPHYGSPFLWKVDPEVNSKIGWQLGYENNFIAAEKGSELIKDWFDQLLKAIQTPYEQLQREFIRCDIYRDRWTTANDIYLLSMDIVKYVLGRKQKELQQQKNRQFKDACDYYKLWSMNGYMGQQKFRSHTSYDTNNHDNHFLRLYAEQDAELMIGKTLHLTKLYNYPVKYLMSNFISNYQHLDLQFHEESIFMKYMYNSSRHVIKLSGENSQIQQLIINDTQLSSDS